jgi:hypothetical protein
MAKQSLEKENREMIDGLKDKLGELGTAIALNTAATNGLRDVIDRELGRHSMDIQALSGRASVVESRVDTIDIALAKGSSIEKWANAVDERFSKIEKKMTDGFKESSDLIQKITSRLDVGDGWSKGARWAAAAFMVIAAPCVGWVAIQVFCQVFLHGRPLG